MILPVILAMLIGHWYMRDRKLVTVVQQLPNWILGILLFTILTVVVLTGGSDSAFIYFQF